MGNRRFIISLACFCFTLFAFLQISKAATRTVDTTSDSAALTACTSAPNNCSLRGAISGAASGDIIEFSPLFTTAVQTINIGTPIVINKSLQIRGPGTTWLNLTGTGNSTGFFNFTGGNNSRIAGMTLSNMTGAQPVGILVQGSGTYAEVNSIWFHDIVGTTTNGASVMATTNSGFFMDLSIFTGNTVGFVVNNGATATLSSNYFENNFYRALSIESTATMRYLEVVNHAGSNVRSMYIDSPSRSVTLSGSSFSNNSNTFGGGAISHLSGNLEIYNSTFYNNSSPRGGAIYSSGAGSLKIVNSTITGNSSPNSAAVDIGVSIPVTVRNTIIAGNTGTQFPDLAGNVGTTSNNLLGIVNPAYTGFIGGGGNAVNNNLVGTAANPLDPKLMPLDYNGGETSSCALMSNSPAVNAGNNCVLTINGCGAGEPSLALDYDTRGQGFPRSLGGRVDIGAFESTFVPTAASVSVSGRILTPDGSGLSNARVVLSDSSGNSRTAVSNSFGYYRFEDIWVGETYVFTVSAKRYSFAPQVVEVLDELNDLNFSAAP